MKLKFAAIAFAATLFAAMPALAGTVSINFNTPSGTLGTSQTYDGGNVTAYGELCQATTATSTSLTSCTAKDLFGKNGGAGETGLGITGEDDNEFGWIDNKHDYVLGLDLSKLNLASVTMDFGSVQEGENVTIWGFSSNPFGSTVSLTSQLLSFNGNSNSTADFTKTFSLNGDSFLVITAQSGDILVDSLYGRTPNATPEPGTLVLLGTGLLMAGLAVRRHLA